MGTIWGMPQCIRIAPLGFRFETTRATSPRYVLTPPRMRVIPIVNSSGTSTACVSASESSPSPRTGRLAFLDHRRVSSAQIRAMRETFALLRSRDASPPGIEASMTSHWQQT